MLNLYNKNGIKNAIQRFFTYFFKRIKTTTL